MLGRVISHILLIFIIIVVILSISINVKAITQPIIDNSIVVNPVIIDLGIIENEQYITEVNIKNNGNDCLLSVDIEGKGSELITAFPNTFELLMGESKKVSIRINNKDIKVGAYDLSILFNSTLFNDSPKAWVTAKGLTSLRLKFIKSGVAIASFNIVDVEKLNEVPFHVVFANFENEENKVDANIKIISEKNNQVLKEINKIVNMNLYPNSGFYRTIEIPLSTENMEMGNYKVEVKAITSSGQILIADKSFKLGVLKGKLIEVSTNNVRRGGKVKFTAMVENIGNLNIKSSLSIVIRDKYGEKIFQDQVELTILPENKEKLVVEMGTEKMDLGSYTVEYEVKYGNDVSNGTMEFKVHLSYKDYIIVIIVSIVFILLIYGIFRQYYKFKLFIKSNKRNL